MRLPRARKGCGAFFILELRQTAARRPTGAGYGQQWHGIQIEAIAATTQHARIAAAIHAIRFAIRSIRA
jgi:hypothetical protein